VEVNQDHSQDNITSNSGVLLTWWFAALAGLVAYPVQGIYKSIHTATHSQTNKAIATARQAEGKYFLDKEKGRGIDVDRMLMTFDNYAQNMDDDDRQSGNVVSNYFCTFPNFTK
jgi:hypothetical protein